MAEKKILKDAIQQKFPEIHIDDSLAKAIDTMTKADVSALAVKSGDEIVGLVTTSDVLFSLATEGEDLQRKISSFMTQCEANVSKTTRNPCIQLDENEDVLSAVKLMYDAGMDHLLVSGHNGKIVGIVSGLQLIRLFGSSA